MELLKGLRSKWRNTINLFEEKVDRWMLKNPLAFISRARFMNQQRRLYNPRYAKMWTLGKWCLTTYLVVSLANLDFNAPFKKEKKYLTEYYVLANSIEYDRLEQVGKEPHLLKLYQRGRKRGLTQIELLELAKHHQANQPTSFLVSHIEYLRQLKS